MGLFVKKEKKYHDDVSIQRKAVFGKEDPNIAELALAGVDADQLPNARGSFGKFFRNPILTNGVNGTLIYLGKLVYEKKKTALIFHKLGSIPNSLTGVGNIDIFEAMDESGTHWDVLFVDMYHPRRSNIAPEGYYLKEYDYVHGDGDNCKSLGTVENCKKFPLRIGSSLISAGNTRYADVEHTIRNLKENGVSLEPPEEHKNKVESIKQILAQQEAEKE
jgi:hypothetical protein